ncbi:MAG: DUF1592 domain-containing protein [Planctomycetota bacterium]
MATVGRALFCFLVLSLTNCLRGQIVDVDRSGFDSIVVPFFKKHCDRCHGSLTQKSDRRFDLLEFPIPDEDALIDLQDALDLINLGEMPPEDEFQPTDVERKAFVRWTTLAIKKYQTESKSTGGQTVLRRLNRREYLNTVSDLFGINTDHFDPTSRFPADQEWHHLDNQGVELVTSGFLLQHYLLAAQKIVEKALPPIEKPPVQKWIFQGGFKQGEYLGATLARWQLKQRIEEFRNQIKSHHKLSKNQIQQRLNDYANQIRKEVPDHIRLYEHPRTQRHVGSYGYVSEFSNGVPYDGFYKIQLKTEAKYRQQHYDQNYAQTRRDEPFVLAIVPGDHKEGSLHLPQSREPVLARIELADEVIEHHESRIWLDKGTTPRFIFANGAHQARQALIKTGNIDMELAGIVPSTPQDAFGYGIKHSKFPQIRIRSVTIEGPFYDQWPNSNHRLLAIDNESGRQGYIGEESINGLTAFLEKAWRRPVELPEIHRIQSVIESRIQHGISADQAFRDGVIASLCMPSFIYLDKKLNEQGRLDDHSLASRLSYFLWSSMPDSKLRQAADEGRLSDPSELEKQVLRMLQDEKSDRFVQDFLGAWLNLDALGNTPPDINQFREYYADHLEETMKQETFYFTKHILDENLSIDHFIDSDFTFANSAIARFYDLNHQGLDHSFQKVHLSDKRRGGLLGQPSVLTITANGVDTSPIVRGVWILDNLLGTPPSPPPPDIEPLDPDTRGAKTIREQLDKHRTNPSCAECHRKIDPLGFALENYDAIGRWRTRYRKRGKPIDASGTLPGGKEFRSIQEFKQLLLQQRHKVARALVEKLFAYALGRGVEISDRPEIDRILTITEPQGWQFKTLIKEIILSESFRQP